MIDKTQLYYYVCFVLERGERTGKYTYIQSCMKDRFRSAFHSLHTSIKYQTNIKC